MDDQEVTLSSNVWDTGRWARESGVRIDFMTEYSFRVLARHAPVAGKHILELGAGTGRLSYLCLQHGAASVTMVDSSSRAIDLMRGLFGEDSRATIVRDEILSFSPDRTFDLVASSGVIEHFRDDDRTAVLRKHVELTTGRAVILHPAYSLYFRFLVRTPLAIKWYGFQRPFSIPEMHARAESAGARIVAEERFHLFNSVPLLHNARVNGSAWAEKLARRYGQFQVTVLEKR